MRPDVACSGNEKRREKNEKKKGCFPLLWADSICLCSFFHLIRWCFVCFCCRFSFGPASLCKHMQAFRLHAIFPLWRIFSLSGAAPSHLENSLENIASKDKVEDQETKVPCRCKANVESPLKKTYNQNEKWMVDSRILQRLSKNHRADYLGIR